MVSENVIRCLRQGKSTSYYDKKNRYVEVTAPVISEEKAVTGVMLAVFLWIRSWMDPYAARTGGRSSDRSLLVVLSLGYLWQDGLYVRLEGSLRLLRM